MTEINNKESIFKLLLEKEAFFLAIISILSFLLPLTYEVGYLEFYNAPKTFIQINPITIVSVFLVISIPVLGVVVNIFQIATELPSTKNLFGRALLKCMLITCPTVMAMAIVSWGSNPAEPLEFFKYFLGLPLALFFIYMIFTLLLCLATCDDFSKELFLKKMDVIDGIFSLNNKRSILKGVFYVIIFLFLLFFIYTFGFNQASKKTGYWVVDNQPNLFLVANYDNFAIINHWDNNSEYFMNCNEVREISGSSIKLRFHKLNKPLKKPKIENETYAHCR